MGKGPTSTSPEPAKRDTDEPHPKKEDEKQKKPQKPWVKKRWVALARLTPESGRVSVLGRVLAVGRATVARDRRGKSGRVAKAVIGDETATVTLYLWNDEIGTVRRGEVIFVNKGRVSLVGGRLRLTLGEGSLAKPEIEIPRVNRSVDMSKRDPGQSKV